MVLVIGVTSMGIAAAIATVYRLATISWAILLVGLFVPFAFGMYWKRANRSGALAAFVGGFLTWLGGTFYFYPATKAANTVDGVLALEEAVWDAVYIAYHAGGAGVPGPDGAGLAADPASRSADAADRRRRPTAAADRPAGRGAAPADVLTSDLNRNQEKTKGTCRRGRNAIGQVHESLRPSAVGHRGPSLRSPSSDCTLLTLYALTSAR